MVWTFGLFGLFGHFRRQGFLKLALKSKVAKKQKGSKRGLVGPDGLDFWTVWTFSPPAF